MQVRPHRSQAGRAGADPPLETEETSRDLFRALAGRLVDVPVSEMREAERIYNEKKPAKKSES